MKISVLTPTYNRGTLLRNLYESLIENSKYDMNVEWLIMDDGSTDTTKEYIEQLQEQNKIEIKYFYQENQGKMVAINNLMKEVTGDIIVDCDSDDCFTSNAFEIIKDEYEKNKDKLNNVYALCFLKYDNNGNNIGKKFTKNKTTMFDLYFKEGEDGEKALVFLTDVRKQYKHKLEHGEKFITEARLYHEMDLNFNIICINQPIMICQYQESGYTKNINQQFKENPYGYFEYFKEILNRDMRGVTFKKRLYAIKHYILFGYLTNKCTGKYIKDAINKILYYLLYIPRNLEK